MSWCVCPRERREQCVYFREWCARRLLAQTTDGLEDIRLMAKQLRQILDEVDEMTEKGENYEEFEAELLKDPEVRKEYEALKPKYDTIRKRLKGDDASWQ